MESSKQNGVKAKISLKDAVKQQLEAKKNSTKSTKTTGNPIQQTPKMKSQQSKKVTQSSRKMGI
ncbi:hypothetical protein [Sporosarcina sp. Marseille-Q4943]|uniref:hypothetical protein n=1 Tax=Sporosarcina sp. Marseille-Q4943 TaxID=2942204 RepID=UPI00208DC089|nr:hypothetical protein [Sporosarcina sp. Marseille-Q4943]